MSVPAKDRRRELRQLGEARAKLDRFSERMESLGGSRPCIWCDLVRPLTDLDVKGICSACHISWGARLPSEPSVPPAVLKMASKAVYVDASYQDGIAGLGVCGALGEHLQQVEATGSNEAEIMALRWALRLATEVGAEGLVFRTDNEAAYLWFHKRDGRGPGWTCEQVPRHRNKRADYLAGRARLAVAA